MTLSPDDIAEAGIVLGGTTIELRCNRGYSLNVLSTHTCGDSGTWTFTAEPTCAGKYSEIVESKYLA